MSLENEVPSLELCKKWKEIDGRQDTVLCWDTSFSKPRVIIRGNYDEERYSSIIAAPMVGELMEWYRNSIGCIWPVNWEEKKEKWVIEIIGDEEPLVDKLSNVLMQTAIWEKEDKK